MRKSALGALERSQPNKLISVTTKIPSQNLRYAICSLATSSSDLNPPGWFSDKYTSDCLRRHLTTQGANTALNSGSCLADFFLVVVYCEGSSESARHVFPQLAVLHKKGSQRHMQVAAVKGAEETLGLPGGFLLLSFYQTEVLQNPQIGAHVFDVPPGQGGELALYRLYVPAQTSSHSRGLSTRTP